MTLTTVDPASRLQGKGLAGSQDSGQESGLRILSLSCVYPNRCDPFRGLFVQARLQAMARQAVVKVIAPVPLVDYADAAAGKRGGAPIPSRQWDRQLEVIHPRWVYPPWGGWFNAVCLFLSLLGPVRRLRKRFRFQVLDVHFCYPEGIAAAMLARVLRCPFTVTVRGNELVHSRHFFRRLCMRWALRRASRVITVSNVLRSLAISLEARPDKVITIPNGIDARLFFPRDQAESRRKHNLPLDGCFILTAGRLVEEKGHHGIILALKGLLERGHAAQLLIVGGPDSGDRGYEKKLRRLASDLGLESAVHFLGQVQQEALGEFLSAADVFCLASAREGWPNVVHEALACGTPVVATDVGAVPDMIPSRQYGFVVPPHDQPALEEALRRALEKSWDRAAIAAWGQSRPWAQVGKEVIDQIHQVLAEKFAPEAE